MRTSPLRPWFVAVGFFLGSLPVFGQRRFAVEETTIDDIHDAIRRGDTTCVQIVQAYLERARAYNGICTQLVTQDGNPIPPGKGAIRAGAPLVFPSTTVAVGEILPDYADYKGLPIELGRMEPDSIRPQRPAAVRHGDRYERRGPAQRAQYAQPSGRAVGNVSG